MREHERLISRSSFEIFIILCSFILWGLQLSGDDKWMKRKPNLYSLSRKSAVQELNTYWCVCSPLGIEMKEKKTRIIRVMFFQQTFDVCYATDLQLKSTCQRLCDSLQHWRRINKCVWQWNSLLLTVSVPITTTCHTASGFLILAVEDIFT